MESRPLYKPTTQGTSPLPNLSLSQSRSGVAVTATFTVGGAGVVWRWEGRLWLVQRVVAACTDTAAVLVLTGACVT